jgi:UDP-3-O-[3-hydroxymyristoyl] glucosamine N-acyltransferase LpxD
LNKISETARIGQDGFRYNRDESGKLIEIPHNFSVKLGDDLRIGEFVTIDKGRWRDTEIGDNTKIDHYAHIAHNAIIGKSCLIHAFVNVCGGVEIGDYSEVFPHANISPQVKIGKNCIIASHSFVKNNINDNELWAGCPARKIRDV